MKISATDKDTTIIEFTRSELEGCRLTYENLASDTARSREVLLTIINETARISGHRGIADCNTAMDILPDGEGGCVIILRTLRVRAAETFGIFYSEGIDGIIDLSRALRKESGTLTLYRRGDGWYLTARGGESLMRLCGEFLTLLSHSQTDESRLIESSERIGELKEIFGSRASEK